MHDSKVMPWMDGQTDRQTDRQTGSKAGRKVGRQAGRLTLTSLPMAK